MGADMIGYLVKGPRKITKRQKTAAAKELLRLACRWQSKSTYECANCGSVKDKIQEIIEEDNCCDCCGSEYPLYLQEITCLTQAEEKVTKWCADWPPSYRDCNYRTDPDNSKELLVFAGDMTWGDSPQGRGYNYLKELLNSGVANKLGIR